MLEFDPEWRFKSPGELPLEASRELFGFACTAATSGDERRVLEAFKKHFAPIAGESYVQSTSTSWATRDLERLMLEAGDNAPLFIATLHHACEEVRRMGASVPDVEALNCVLLRHEAGFVIHPPRIVRSDAEPSALPVRSPSVREQTNALIATSLEESQRLLQEGRNRQAILEVLWLMETVSTAFKGAATESGSVEGKYFVKIVKDLRRLHRGKTLDQVLGWISNLHGYLSSPTGGGIRHGTDVDDPKDLADHEARLFCNLVREYIRYLLAAHERQGQGPS